MWLRTALINLAGRRLETHDLYQVTANGPIRGRISTGTHPYPIPREIQRVTDLCSAR